MKYIFPRLFDTHYTDVEERPTQVQVLDTGQTGQFLRQRWLKSYEELLYKVY